MTHTERDVSSYNQDDDDVDVEERVALVGGAIIAHLSIRAPVSTAVGDLVTLQEYQRVSMLAKTPPLFKPSAPS